MNGPMMNYSYSRYLESLKETPYHKSELPKIKIDFSGMIKYARKHGKKTIDLTDEEKSMFVG